MTETTPGQAARSELLKLLGELWRNSPVERSALDDVLRAADAYAAAATTPAEPKPAPELAAAMAETRELRELLVEILRTFGDSSGDGWRSRVGQVKYRQWRKLAGLPE